MPLLIKAEVVVNTCPGSCCSQKHVGRARAEPLVIPVYVRPVLPHISQMIGYGSASLHVNSI